MSSRVKRQKSEQLINEDTAASFCFHDQFNILVCEKTVGMPIGLVEHFIRACCC